MAASDLHSPSRAALLSLIAPRPPAADRVAHAATWDWPWIVERATAHKVLALLAARITELGLLDAVPSDLRPQLAAATVAAVERNQAAAHTLRTVAATLRTAGVPIMVLKGALLVEQLYGDPRLRRFYDLDLVVQPEHVARAEAALQEHYRVWGIPELLGFDPKTPAEHVIADRVGRRWLMRVYHQLALVPRDRELLPIDLHWDITPPGRIAIRGAQCWPYAEPGTVAGVEVQRLKTPAMVVHLAVHALASWQWGFRLLHLCDLAWATMRPEMDVDALRRTADAWRASRPLAIAVGAARQAFGLELPSPLWDWLAPLATPAALRLLSARMLVDELAQPPPSGWRRVGADARWTLAVGATRANLTFLTGKWLSRVQFAAQRRRGATARGRPAINQEGSS